MTSAETKLGRTALIVAHVAGMVDLVSMPVWVNTLIHSYEFSPPQAGGLVTMFLGGVVISSIFWSPRFGRVRGRVLVPIGFALSALMFLLVTRTTEFPIIAVCSAIGGLSAGMSLSLTHGTIGHSSNPHRLFSYASMAIGVFALVFLGAAPSIIAATSGATLFYIFAGVMAAGAVATVIGFPEPTIVDLPSDHVQIPAKFNLAIWCNIIGTMLLMLNQVMLMSFVEHIGLGRGFGHDKVVAVLAAIGFVNLAPGVLAALLEKRLSATSVAIGGTIVQAIFAWFATHSTTFLLYAIPSVFATFIVIFVHTFLFGLLARLEPSNRALASTPAMLMGGSALAPFIAGAVVHFGGYEALGVAILIGTVFNLGLFFLLRSEVRKLDAAHELRSEAWA